MKYQTLFFLTRFQVKIGFQGVAAIYTSLLEIHDHIRTFK